MERECLKVDRGIIPDGNLYSILEINPFFVLLPYLWSDLKFYGDEKGAYKMKPLSDIFQENRDKRTPPLQPISQDLIEALNDNPRLLATIKKVCISQNSSLKIKFS